MIIVGAISTSTRRGNVDTTTESDVSCRGNVVAIDYTQNILSVILETKCLLRECGHKQNNYWIACDECGA